MNKELVILIGPPCSGKTYYAARHFKKHVRISQDDQGKEGCRRAFAEALMNEKSIVVDRMNFDLFQRQQYRDPAKAANYTIKYVWFDVDRQTCLNRLATRENHPTLDPDDDHEAVLNFYQRSFVPPSKEEYNTIEVIIKKHFVDILDIRPLIKDQKVIIVGDVHGCFDQLIELLTKCQYMLGDFVVFTGDLIDRGPKSREVLEFVMSMPNFYCVEGNHDNKLKRYCMGRKIKMTNGLDATVRQCANMDQHQLLHWLIQLPLIIRVPDIDNKPSYVVHAGVDGRYPIDRQKVETCLYVRGLNSRDYFDIDDGIWWDTLDNSYNIISGHIVSDISTPAKSVFSLDGGACRGGVMRGLVIKDGKSKIMEIPGLTNQDRCDPRNVSSRNELLSQGLLRCDNLDDLRVYTYTDACVHSRNWNEVTKNSRGIVLNTKTGEVVAKPFPKFFNVNETLETQTKQLPWRLKHTVFQKLDGWLGVLYRHDGRHKISTRGSFHSEGAKWATEFLQKNFDLSDLPDSITLVFEIISPVTKIIVDYSGKEDLVLLAAFDRHSGEEITWDQVAMWAKKFGFNTPEIWKFDSPNDIVKWLSCANGKTYEGFVIRFYDGRRVKMKGEDYLRRARILANLTPLSIWRAMIDGRVSNEYISLIDDDYKKEFEEIKSTLEESFSNIKTAIINNFSELMKPPSPAMPRAEFARRVKEYNIQHKKVMFAWLDRKLGSVDKYILETIRPKANSLRKDV